MNDETALSRIEDASLNASAPTQQRWLDGWLVRLCPGQARRARCINAVAPGRRSPGAKLDECEALYAAAGLPALVRLTPFSLPADLDRLLEQRGWALEGDTWVMTRPPATATPEQPAPLSEGQRWAWLPPAEFAAAVGRLRASTPIEVQAHAGRLRDAPLPGLGLAIVDAQGQALATGQVVCEGPVVGLYDVVTAAAHRGHGLGHALCHQLLQRAAREGADQAYLQVDADNHAARRLYRRMGFSDAYPYHYRRAPGG